MYLYSRSLVLRGDPQKTREWAIETLAVANEKSDLDVSLWAGLYGQPLGSMTYSAFVQSRAALEAATASLVRDKAYRNQVAKGAEFLTQQPEDGLIEVIHTAGGEFRPQDVGAVASATTAIVATGKFSAAGVWAVEMADVVSSIIDTPIVLGRATSGPFGTLVWIGVSPDMATADRADEALGKDPSYVEKLDASAGLFVEGSAYQLTTHRIA